MDKIRDRKKESMAARLMRLSKYIFLGVVCIYTYLWAGVGNGTNLVREDLRLSEVERGDFNLEVAGYGQLQAKNQVLLNASAKGTVAKIYIKPGMAVKESDPIIDILNPLVDEEVLLESRKLDEMNVLVN